MRTEEDELARKQDMWGGGFQAKRRMAADKMQEPVAHILQFMKELRPAIGPMATMGKSKTTQEWFDIVINEIERLQAAQEKNT